LVPPLEIDLFVGATGSIIVVVVVVVVEGLFVITL
jgi:hypothetical protein